MSSLSARLLSMLGGFKPLPPWVPHSPTAKQFAFLTVDAQEAMFGGAAGGGKSDALLMAGLQYTDVPGYTGLILRRTWSDLTLPGAILDRAHQWLGGRPEVCRWSAKHGRYEFSSGAVLAFGHLDTENDKYRYQGSEFQFIAFDELTQFSRTQYLYMLSRLRRLAGSTVPIRMRSASNPGGVGHDWVKDRFITAPGPRLFIPSKLDDNPHVDREQYELALAELDHVTRAQLRHGDWGIRPDGDLFKRAWLQARVDVAPECPRFRVRFWDLAATETKGGPELKARKAGDPDYTAGALLSWDNGRYVLEDLIAVRESPGEVEKLIRRTAEADSKLRSAEPLETLIEQEGGASGKFAIHHLLSSVLKGYLAYGVPSTGDKVHYARALSAAAEGGTFAMVRAGWNEEFVDEAAAFPLGAHDDRVDAASKALSRIAKRLRQGNTIGMPGQVGAGPRQQGIG